MTDCNHATVRRSSSDQPWICDRCGDQLDELPRVELVTDLHSVDYYRQGKPQRVEIAAAPPAPAYRVLRPAQPYDLATPGTPAGILAVARAADEGGAWAYLATLALAEEAETGEVVASLALRLRCDREQRRAWVQYVRTKGGAWSPSAPGGLGGAALLDGGRVRPVGIEELKAIVRGQPWTPPAPRTVYTVPCPVCQQPAKLTAGGKIFANHRCEAKHVEGRS